MELFKLERAAKQGLPLPDGLTLTESWLYLSIRMLAKEYKSGSINAEQARIEKMKLISTYELIAQGEKIHRKEIENRLRLSKYMVNAEKGECENCKAMSRILSGILY